MNDMRYLEGLADGNYHRDTPITLRVLQVGVAEDDIDLALADEVRVIVRDLPSSVVKTGHVTGWTNAVGEVRQWSLWNRHGRTDDTSDDFSYVMTGRRLPPGFPALTALVAALPDLANMRLNALYPGSRLSPHEEHLPRKIEPGMVGLRARFHLPIATNSGARVLADGRWYHLKVGNVYCFNNGCVHAAVNDGENVRYHLVWDQLMTRRAYDVMFSTGAPGVFTHVIDDVPVYEHEIVTDWAPSGGMTEDDFSWRRLVFI